MDLTTQHDIALERAKSDLQRLFREHEIRFSHLHEKRAEIIAQLYQMTVETNDAAEACVQAFREKPDKRRFDLAKEAIDRGDELAEFVIRNKIYFSRHLAAELGELYGPLKRSLEPCSVWRIPVKRPNQSMKRIATRREK